MAKLSRDDAIIIAGFAAFCFDRAIGTKSMTLHAIVFLFAATLFSYAFWNFESTNNWTKWKKILIILFIYALSTWFFVDAYSSAKKEDDRFLISSIQRVYYEKEILEAGNQEITLLLNNPNPRTLTYGYALAKVLESPNIHISVFSTSGAYPNGISVEAGSERQDFARKFLMVLKNSGIVADDIEIKKSLNKHELMLMLSFP